MKQKVKFSLFSIILTALVLILFVVETVMLLDNEGKLTLFCIIMGGVTIAGLHYCPTSIEANEFGVSLHCLLSSPKTFLYYINLEALRHAILTPREEGETTIYMNVLNF